MHLSLAAIVVNEYDPAIDFFVGTLGFELVEDSPSPSSSGLMISMRRTGGCRRRGSGS